MKKIKISLIVLLFSSLAQAQNIGIHQQGLKQVVEDFRVSIIEHNDEDKFFNLFLHDSITWGAIVIGKYRDKVLEQKPDFTFQSSDLKSFFNILKDGDEEKFYNVQIDARDEFATISFDYTFNRNSTIQNWGTEYWSLILINDSWKITSVTWSMTLEELEKCSFVSDDYFRLQQ